MTMKRSTIALRRSAILCAAFLAAALPLSAQEPASADEGTAPDAAAAAPATTLSIGLAGIYDLERGFSTREEIAFSHDSRYFDLIADLSVNSDGKYAAAMSNLPGGDLFHFYFLMEEGGLRSQIGPFRLAGGLLKHYDVIDSPYSLFVNSAGRAADILELSYESGFFFYQTRWISLNIDSALTDAVPPDTAWPSGYPDRGANLKTYGFKLGDGMRFGFQDAAVYSGRAFDFEYFLNPIPMYFIQYEHGTAGRPWNRDYNDNDLVGAFWDWKRDDGLSFNAQVLVDDFNVHAIAPSTVWNPWKLAFSLGGRMETDIGSFGFYTAGATKYVFEPIDMNTTDISKSAYGYTYYPDTRFDIDKSSGVEWSPISIEDNAVGYKNGENNLAFRADWKGELAGVDLGAALEFRLAGENSPANPWASLGHFATGGTKWLGSDAVLEKRILVGLNGSRSFGKLKASAALTAGVAIDALSLEAPGGQDLAEGGKEQYLYLFRPTEGLVQGIFKLTLGATYSF
jgi:hypothetical protein